MLQLHTQWKVLIPFEFKLLLSSTANSMVKFLMLDLLNLFCSLLKISSYLISNWRILFVRLHFVLPLLVAAEAPEAKKEPSNLLALPIMYEAPYPSIVSDLADVALVGVA